MTDPEPPNLAAAAQFWPLADNQPKKIRRGRQWPSRTAAEKKSSPSSLMPF